MGSWRACFSRSERDGSQAESDCDLSGDHLRWWLELECRVLGSLCHRERAHLSYPAAEAAVHTHEELAKLLRPNVWYLDGRKECTEARKMQRRAGGLPSGSIGRSQCVFQ